ncbi:MAG: hypothetical protein M3025_05375 [Actinomycetota bacterium]|nr:hypothetical protein [Actinomycetota bacterium]
MRLRSVVVVMICTASCGYPLVSAPAGTAAAGLRSCGAYRGYSNIRERRTSCSQARRVAKAEWYNRRASGSAYVNGFHCRRLIDHAAGVIRFSCTEGPAGIWFTEYAD